MHLVHQKSLRVKRLLIVQPYIPEYRAPLFSYLQAGLLNIGVELHVAVGRAGTEQQLRKDATSDGFAHQLEQRDLAIRRHGIRYKKVHGLIKELQPDLLIVEQAIKNLESWPLLLSQSRSKPLIGIWGQGGYYSHTPSSLSKRLKNLMTHRGRWFFAYTDEGSRFVVDHGFPKDRVTTLNNSTDTLQLRQDLAAISPQELRDMRNRYSLVEGKTALFMGGVDPRKGVEFLIEAARRIRSIDSEFHLLVAGDGSDVGRVKQAQAMGIPIHYLGRASGATKAELLAVSDFLLIPEWVGLVATDALAAGRPVVTTDHSFHAPEIAYLVDGTCRITTLHDVKTYSNAVVELMNNPDQLSQMQASSRREGNSYSIQSMGDRFIEGIHHWVKRDLSAG